MKYIKFKRNYYSRFANYNLIKNVKYKIKYEDANFYYTIKNIRVYKEQQYKIYNVIEINSI